MDGRGGTRGAVSITVNCDGTSHGLTVSGLYGEGVSWTNVPSAEGMMRFKRVTGRTSDCERTS